MMYAVYIRDQRGREFQNNAEADSPEGAAEKACDWFEQWYGPKPRPGMDLRVENVYGAERRQWIVRVPITQ